LAWKNRGFELKSEAFFKTISGLARFVSDGNTGDLVFIQGEGRTYGIDIYAKQSFGKHAFWAAYTLSKTEERFSFSEDKNFHPAPHDQRHEVKTAALFNFSPFYLSANYVFGSGIPNPSFTENSTRYSRLDVAALYKINFQKMSVETGISILNVLDQQNVRYDNFSAFPQSPNSKLVATPFSPTVFLNLTF
jgi:hypothetical protein